MRIAQVAPLYESVPPQTYGGTERVVSYLTEELVALGHDVSLFASGDSVTRAQLIPVCERSLRLDPHCVDSLAHHIVMMERVIRSAEQFDVLHYHIDYLHYPFTRRHHTPTVTTLHGRLDLPDLVPLYDEFRDIPVVSISDSQRRPLPQARWVDTVYHGLPPELYRFNDTPGDYLAFLGRISPEKRCDRAIEIARRVGMKLKIAAKVDATDRDYFDAEIAPLLDQPGIEFFGEVDEPEKDELLGGAYALLFPIDWPEPFGLVMIESMGCGTPVIAFDCGSVPEVMTDGVTGFIVTNVDDAVAAVRDVETLSRLKCRRVFEERFSARNMAEDYVRVYRKLMASP